MVVLGYFRRYGFIDWKSNSSHFWFGDDHRNGDFSQRHTDEFNNSYGFMTSSPIFEGELDAYARQTNQAS